MWASGSPASLSTWPLVLSRRRPTLDDVALVSVMASLYGGTATASFRHCPEHGRLSAATEAEWAVTRALLSVVGLWSRGRQSLAVASGI